MYLNKYFNICNIYTAIWCLYLLQKPLNFESTIYSQFLLIINLAISIFYAIYAAQKYRLPTFFKALNLLLLLFTIYGIVLLFSNEKYVIQGIEKVVPHYNYLKSIYITLLPLYPYYVFARKEILTEDLLRKYVFVIIPIITSLFFYSLNQMKFTAMMMGIDREEFTVNEGYLFVALIPMVSFLRNKPIIFQYIMLAFCMYFIITCMKRGAIITSALCLVFFLYKTYRKGIQENKIAFIIPSLLLIIAAYYFVEFQFNTSDYFNQRFEDTIEGRTSRRDVLYLTFWYHFIDSPLLQLILGNGANATLQIAGQYAHNDWLEIAINQGLLGIIVFSVYWICCYKTWRESNENETISLALGLVFIIYFTKTLYSMSYTDMPFYVSMVIGYCIAKLPPKRPTIKYDTFYHPHITKRLIIR